MINAFFNQRKFLNGVSTITTSRSIFRIIQKYFFRIYNVDYFLMIFKIVDNALRNCNQSLYNETNVEIAVALIENTIKQDVFTSNQITIFTFYCAQLKLYQ